MAYNTRRRRHRQPKPDRRRALELLAGCGPEGCSEAVLKAHGFTTEQLVELVRAGLVSATPTACPRRPGDARGRHVANNGAGVEGAGGDKEVTIREEIMFSIFVAAAVVMGWKLVLLTLDHVLG